ncbi:hypothetical protein CVT24_011137 [Panaeolus cyanescens]|uniref:F-box domain-containing protein n=1 Tax=Panaeolus cyanescens TaxID=181874 RepID=A0A409YG93_9AGAR|nr:hypothetical protein CVT24_011137 [Panaeolus cyanescens]
MPPSAHEPSSFPLNLCHVSSRWRYLVFGIPEMWTCIRVEAFGKTHPRSHRNILDVRTEQIKMWFKNAKGRPFALYLDLTSIEPTPGQMVNGQWTRFLRFVLIERAKSLRGLHLVFTDPNFYDEIFRPGSTMFPILEEIRLQYQSIFAGIQFLNLEQFHLFIDFNNGHHSKFDWSPSQRYHDHFLAQLNGLRVLSIVNPGDISEKQLIEVFESVPRLEKLALDVGCFAHPRLLYALNESEDGSPSLMPDLKEVYVFLERVEPFFNEDNGDITMRSIAQMVSTRSLARGTHAALQKAVFWTHDPYGRLSGRRWKDCERTLKTQLDNTFGLDSSVHSVWDSSDWFSWWTGTSAIEDKCL